MSGENILTKGEKPSKEKSSCQFSVSASQESNQTIEIIKQGKEYRFCHFATLKREGTEIACPFADRDTESAHDRGGPGRSLFIMNGTVY